MFFFGGGSGGGGGMLFYYPLSVIALSLAGGSGSRAVQGLGVQGPNHQAFCLDVLRFPG